MRVLILSGIFPTEINKGSGIFITRRCQILNEYCDYNLYALQEYDSKLVSIINRLRNKPVRTKKSTCLRIDDVTWNFIYVKVNIIGFILRKMNYVLYLRKIVLKSIMRKVNINDYDLIHTHWAFPEGYLGRLIQEKFKIPLIITTHGSDIHTNPYSNEIIKKYTINSLNDANKVIFVSENLLQRAINLGYHNKNSIVINNGVDWDKFRILDEDTKLKNPFRKKIVGFIGNIIPVKGADRIPTIFENIKKFINDVEFILVGEGNLKDLVEKELKKKNINAKFYGFVDPDKVCFFMNAMDVVILPSRNEGFPNVVLEANACGVPVVGSKVGGIAEAIAECGIVVEDGINFEQRFASAVIECLSKPFNKRFLRDKKHKFHWKFIVKKEYNLYKELTDKETNL